jgi:hypothetical protein
MTNKFEFYSDPAHGWLKVPKELLFILGIGGSISQFSYDRNGYVYLEEDCDLTRFMGAFKDSFGYLPIINDRRPSKKSSSIRSYERYDKVYEMNRRSKVYNKA